MTNAEHYQNLKDILETSFAKQIKNGDLTLEEANSYIDEYAIKPLREMTSKQLSEEYKKC